MSCPSSKFFAFLFHHRWAVPVLAELHPSSGSKYVTLVNNLRISKDSLRWTLEWLIEAGLVMRNPGHGHPMRPEYVLTSEGSRIARHCVPLLGALRIHDLERTGLHKWSMPIVHAVRCGLRTFTALKHVLPGITARALSLALADLQRARVMERVDIEESEAGSYRLTKTGMQIASLLSVFVQEHSAGTAVGRARPAPGPEPL
jgi:DNA-binding HxlR family transcriptional regulator